MNWHDYFNMMSDWKKLPAYKAEPRVDSFLGFFLPEMFSEFFGDRILGIIPELPLRLGTLKTSLEGTKYAELSYKVDFYLVGISGINYFVEVKTDIGSRRDKQDAYLSQAAEKKMRCIIDGIIRISKVSSYETKYTKLILKLSKLGLLNESLEFIGKSDDIKIVYVQPSKKDEDQICIDFTRISEWLEKKGSVYSFESCFAAALRKWAID